MKISELFAKLNFLHECRENRLRFFECPSTLFIIMGILNIASMLGAYFISSDYFDEPQISALIAILVSVLVLTIGYFVVKSFERIADANKLKTDFLNIATHQLLTPLTSISWIAELLLSKKTVEANQGTLDYIELIKKSNKKMIKLITDLLDVSRIEENRIEMQPEIVDMLKTTEDIVHEIVPVSDFPNAEISLAAEGSDFRVFIDPMRLKMVIQNLIDNAIKYSVTKKDIVIKIMAKDKDRITFEITDKGIGIEERDRDKIFKKFSRADGVKMITAGSGLGLFIAKFIIEKAGGKIGFDSNGTNGSMFWFTLPVSQNNKGPKPN